MSGTPTGDHTADVDECSRAVTPRVTDTDERGAGVDLVPPRAVWMSPRAVKTWIGAGFLTIGLLFEFLLTTPNITLATILSVPFDVSDVFFLGAVAVSGTPVVRAGYRSARAHDLDIDLLMGTAILAAAGIGYFVEAATLAVLFNIAELLEDYAMDRARGSLRELIELSPDEATVRRNHEQVTVPAEHVDIGEVVVIRPGEKIPLDGIVIEGLSAVDESPITGESVPVDKGHGDEVYAGSLNQEGYLEVQATATASGSTLSRIIGLVEGAQATQTETEQFVDRFAGYYTPVVVGLAILTAALPPLLITEPFTVGVVGYSLAFTGTWQTWFVRGLTLLVIACPCAFVISTPVSVVSGITSAAKNGVLIKGGTHLEAMGDVDVVALDKTGTLTKGELAVTEIVPFGKTSDRELLSIAAGLEQRSEHPIAGAILSRAEDEGIDEPIEPDTFESVVGKGIRADWNGDTYYVGNPALFEAIGIDLSRLRAAADGGAIPGEAATESDQDGAIDGLLSRLERAGNTIILVGTDTTVLGLIAIGDEVRPTARWTVERLRTLGVNRIVMLTGDNDGTARAIAEKVGIDEYRAELLPAEKVRSVAELQTEFGEVAMVGDGINDAPALATAEVGIVMGAAGSDTALETADIALMADDLAKLPYVYALSHRANDVIRQNIWSSLGVKFLLALGVPIGVVGVALAVVVGDMGMSLGVTGNAMRLARVTPEQVVQ